MIPFKRTDRGLSLFALRRSFCHAVRRGIHAAAIAMVASGFTEESNRIKTALQGSVEKVVLMCRIWLHPVSRRRATSRCLGSISFANAQQQHQDACREATATSPSPRCSERGAGSLAKCCSQRGDEAIVVQWFREDLNFRRQRSRGGKLPR